MEGSVTDPRSTGKEVLGEEQKALPCRHSMCLSMSSSIRRRRSRGSEKRLPYCVRTRSAVPGLNGEPPMCLPMDAPPLDCLGVKRLVIEAVAVSSKGLLDPACLSQLASVHAELAAIHDRRAQSHHEAAPDEPPAQTWLAVERDEADAREGYGDGYGATDSSDRVDSHTVSSRKRDHPSTATST